MRGPAPMSPPGDDLRWELLGGLAGGILSVAAIVLVREGPPKYVLTVFGGALLLAILALIRNRRLFSLYMVITLAPIGLRLSFMDFPHMGGAGATYVEAVDPFLLVLLYFQVRDQLRDYRPPYRFPPALALWSAMIVLGVGSVLFMHTLRITAANEVVRMTKLLLLATLIVNEVVTRRQFKHVVIALMMGVVLQGSIALAEYLRGRQLGLGVLGEATDEEIKTLSDATLLNGDFVYRVGALLGHANLLAAYLALLLPIAIALILAPVSRRLKVLLGLALLLGQPTLILTLSRAAWIDFSVAFLIVLVFGASNAVSRRMYLLTRVVIVTGTVAVAAALSPHIIQRLTETDPSAVEFRVRWLETAKAMIIDHPVLGMGLNTYVFEQLPYGRDKTPEQMTDRYGKYWPAVHNSWVLTWVEQGTIGFILLVGIHITVIRVAIRNLRIRDPMMHALGVGLFAGFVAIMLDGLASFFIRVEGPARMFWIDLALILAVGFWRRANEEIIPVRAEPLAPGRPAGAIMASGRPRWLPSRQSILR